MNKETILTYDASVDWSKINLLPQANLEVKVFGNEILVLRLPAKMPNPWRRFWQWVFIGTTYKKL